MQANVAPRRGEEKEALVLEMDKDGTGPTLFSLTTGHLALGSNESDPVLREQLIMSEVQGYVFLSP